MKTTVYITYVSHITFCILFQRVRLPVLSQIRHAAKRHIKRPKPFPNVRFEASAQSLKAKGWIHWNHMGDHEFYWNCLTISDTIDHKIHTHRRRMLHKLLISLKLMPTWPPVTEERNLTWRKSSAFWCSVHKNSIIRCRTHGCMKLKI